MTGIALPVPKRWNPVPVKVKRLNIDEPVRDEVFGTPAGGLEKGFYEELSLLAQVVYAEKDGTERTMAGKYDRTKGHLCFTLEYLQSVGLDPLSGAVFLKPGDVVTEITGLVVDYKIIEVRPAGHLLGRPNLMLVYFDRNVDNQPKMTS